MIALKARFGRPAASKYHRVDPHLKRLCRTHARGLPQAAWPPRATGRRLPYAQTCSRPLCDPYSGGRRSPRSKPMLSVFGSKKASGAGEKAICL